MFCRETDVSRRSLCGTRTNTNGALIVSDNWHIGGRCSRSPPACTQTNGHGNALSAVIAGPRAAEQHNARGAHTKLDRDSGSAEQNAGQDARVPVIVTTRRGAAERVKGAIHQAGRSPAAGSCVDIDAFSAEMPVGQLRALAARTDGQGFLQMLLSVASADNVGTLATTCCWRRRTGRFAQRGTGRWRAAGLGNRQPRTDRRPRSDNQACKARSTTTGTVRRSRHDPQQRRQVGGPSSSEGGTTS